MATYPRVKLGQSDKEVGGEGRNSKRIEEGQNNSGRRGCGGLVVQTYSAESSPKSEEAETQRKVKC